MPRSRKWFSIAARSRGKVAALWASYMLAAALMHIAMYVGVRQVKLLFCVCASVRYWNCSNAKYRDDFSECVAAGWEGKRGENIFFSAPVRWISENLTM